MKVLDEVQNVHVFAKTSLSQHMFQKCFVQFSMFLLTSCCSLPVFLALAGTAIAGTEDDIEEDALNKQLEKRLDDWLEHIKQVFVRPVVLFPVTLDEDKVIIHQVWVK